jgi:hypothetical protein
MNNIDKIIAYESDELSDKETIELFQDLVDSGLAWKLQGHYGRTAKAYIDAGFVHVGGNRLCVTQEKSDK